MGFSDFFKDSDGRLSSARLIFIIASIAYIVCASLAYLFIIYHGQSYDGATVAYSAGILAFAGKLSYDKYIEQKNGNNKNASTPTA